jgi:hypothetical protein
MAPTLGPSNPLLPPHLANNTSAVVRPRDPPHHPPDDGGIAWSASSMGTTPIVPTIATTITTATIARTATATATTKMTPANDDNDDNDNIKDTVVHHHNHRRNNIEYTRVDGKGLWRSWKRNFKDKLLAVLDLIDNSLDAAMIANRRRIREGRGEDGDDCDNYDDDDHDDDDADFVGRVHVYPDDVRPTSSSSSSSFAAVPDAAPSNPTATTVATSASMSIPPRPPSSSSPPPPSGLCIVNNSRRPVRPLRKVLEIYSSSKTYSGARDIGENGVGLKQGCEYIIIYSYYYVGIIYCACVRR